MRRRALAVHINMEPMLGMLRGGKDFGDYDYLGASVAPDARRAAVVDQCADVRSANDVGLAGAA